jgi:hypothetical protein
MRAPSLTRPRILAAIFIAMYLVYVHAAWDSGYLFVVPEAGDAADYDAIALNIAKGRGFGFYWDDPEYLAPYRGSPDHAGLWDRNSEYYPTSYRPPAVPFLMGVVYKLTDRNFTAWRLVQCAILAGAVTLAASIAAGLGGSLAAILTAVLAWQTDSLTQYAYLFLTEATAAFMVTLFAWTWLRQSRLGWTVRRAAGLGAVLAGLCATRSIFVLWTPVVLFVPRLKDVPGVKGALLPKAACALACLLLIGPWWTRNMIITGARLPFGTEGALNLPAGFGPRALEARGLWRSNHEDGADMIMAQVGGDMRAWETELARYRQRITLRWMSRNPKDVLRLMYLHVWQEVRPHREGLADWLLPLGLLGVFFFRQSPAARLIVVMVGATLFSIAMTWSVGGRFIVPLYPVLTALVAALAAMLVRRVIADDASPGAIPAH